MGEAVGRLEVHARLLRPFSLQAGERAGGPWGRPNARRLCELVLVSPAEGLVTKQSAKPSSPNWAPARRSRPCAGPCSWPGLRWRPSADAAGLLQADRDLVWTTDEIEVDFRAHEEALRYWLSLPPGGRRDDHLAQALAEEGRLLEDEPYADWAIGPRERQEGLRPTSPLGARPRPG